MKAKALIFAVALATTSIIAIPANAVPLAGAGAKSLATTADQASPFVEVRHRRWHRRHSRWHGRWHRHYDYGGAVAAGAIIGLAAGAIAANAAAGNDAVAYCMQRFRSYDPASGTYMGYDGLRHPCP